MKFIAKKNLTLTSVYGTFTFKEGESTEFEPLVRQFSQHFVEAFEPTEKGFVIDNPPEPVVETVEEVMVEKPVKIKTKEKGDN
jgi:hypothetical protein